jgi:hypothetical protein
MNNAWRWVQGRTAPTCRGEAVSLIAHTDRSDDTHSPDLGANTVFRTNERDFFVSCGELDDAVAWRLKLSRMTSGALDSRGGQTTQNRNDLRTEADDTPAPCQW